MTSHEQLTPGALRSRLASEFERRGWEYDLTTGNEIVKRASSAGAVDANALSRSVSGDYLIRNHASRADMQDAIAIAIGGAIVSQEESGRATVQVVINDRSHVINISPGAQLTNTNLNQSGNQLVVAETGPRDDVLAALQALVSAGLSGDWDPSAARELGSVIDAREDIELEDVSKVVREIAEAEGVEPSRVKGFLKEVAANALGGLLSVGITAGLGGLL